MSEPRELEQLTRRKTPRARWSGLAVWILLGGSAASVTSVCAQPGPAAAQPIDQTLEETAKGHGSVSVSYQNTYVNGMLLPAGKAPIGTVRVQSISLDLIYYFADSWSAQVGIPFIESRYRGPAPHCITQSPPQCQGQVVPTQPHPESRFLDDGSYHGAWQDWNLGVAYHANVNDYLLTPSVTAYLPSHDYTFFANAAVGQDLRKLEVAIDLAHQFELTNIYYRVRAAHVFAEKTLGQSIDHNKLDLELGYFLNETWTVKVFGVGKKGNGYTGPPLVRTTEEWYHHDQRALHNYATLGAGFDYHLNDKYTVTTTVQSLVWGQAVFDFKYSLDVHLTREF